MVSKGQGMITFSDQQLAALMRVTSNLPLDKRAAFFERVSAYLQMHVFDDDDGSIEAAIDAALRGIVQEAAVSSELQPKTAREVYLEEIARNPDWREASNTGGIGGARPISRR
jgi:hypothetical protein